MNMPMVNPNSIVGNIRDVVEWSGKKFGELRGYRIIDKDVRLLSHTGGFAIFLPGDLWRKLDYEISLGFPVNEDSKCWIADKGFAFVKIDINPSEVEAINRDYISDDLTVVLDKVESFAIRNFLENEQAFPDNDSFTYGSFLDKPNIDRTVRTSLEGNFQYRF